MGGASMPSGWVDGALIILTRKSAKTFREESIFRLFSWAKPFTVGVWLSLLGTLLTSGLLLFYLEDKSLLQVSANGFLPAGTQNDKKIFEGEYASTIISYIHQAFTVFSGHLDLLPNTHAGQILSFSLSFFAMLMLSSYTANLASFLVIQRSSFVIPIETVDDIIRLGKSICLIGSSGAEQIVQRVSNEQDRDAIIIPKFTAFDSVLGVKSGDCDFAFVSKSHWDWLEITEETNGDCDTIVPVGIPFSNYDNVGFALRSDAGLLCTSLVRDVFNVHFHEMYDEGFMDKAWANHLDKKSNIIDKSCYRGRSGEEEGENNTQLDMTNLGGIFVLHLFFIVWALVGSVKWKDKLRRYESVEEKKGVIVASTQPAQRHGIMNVVPPASNQGIMKQPSSPYFGSSSRRLKLLRANTDITNFTGPSLFMGHNKLKEQQEQENPLPSVSFFQDNYTTNGDPAGKRIVGSSSDEHLMKSFNSLNREIDEKVIQQDSTSTINSGQIDALTRAVDDQYVKMSLVTNRIDKLTNTVEERLDDILRALNMNETNDN